MYSEKEKEASSFKCSAKCAMHVRINSQKFHDLPQHNFRKTSSYVENASDNFKFTNIIEKLYMSVTYIIVKGHQCCPSQPD